MTPSNSRNRLWLYVGIAVCSAAGGGLISLPIPDNAKAISGFLIMIIGAGLVATRAYIDKSPSEVKRPGEEPDLIIKSDQTDVQVQESPKE